MRNRGRSRAAGGLSIVSALALLIASVAPARALEPESLQSVFPGAERAEPFSGAPPAAAAFRGGRLVGYLLSTHDVIGSVGFSGKPLDILVGLGLDGRIAGAQLRRHAEPILVIGIAEERLRRYVAGFAGVDVLGPPALTQVAQRWAGIPDVIAGASISSAVIRDSIVRAARAVARSRGLAGGGAAAARLDRESFAPASWRELVDDGSIARLRLDRARVDAAFGHAAPDSGAAPGELFLELYAALLTPPRVGQNLLGQAAFTRLAARIGADDQAILIAAQGLYSFKGTGYVRGGRFDRIQLVQDEKTIGFTRDRHENVERLGAAGAPELREAGVFVVPAASGFDPLRPWRLQLAVERTDAAKGALLAAFELPYALPARYRIGGAGPEAEAQPETPLWQQIWFDRMGQVGILSAILLALAAILVFQDVLVRDYRLYWWVRHAFLAVTVVWIGWYASAQLSVLNVLTFIQALLADFRWEFFLLDPLIFILWSFVAVALLFWGRGVFCGWLCPFGALHELLNEAAHRLRVPQLAVPFLLHERLWPIKYIAFLALFALSLHAMDMAVLGTEIEPFKTAITLRFARAWPFVAYALALLAAGLFIERFFCRYLCPLGAALAIPARLRMFEWLKRKKECGAECAICAQRCTVQAIHPDGRINPNECIHCLQCQTLYYDDRTCPPLVERRRRRERRAQLSSGADAVAAALAAHRGSRAK